MGPSVGRQTSTTENITFSHSVAGSNDGEGDCVAVKTCEAHPLIYTRTKRIIFHLKIIII